ncbi:MAG: succinate dehydrogenase cytochrome b subunit [Acidimicrobiia bacterium]|nr:succinate dehydrogenase cytochrome b subunit [Acidimicrobiia bacterium]
MAQTMPNLRDPQPIRTRKKPLPFPLNIWQSAVGRKWIMAITGIGLLGFVVAHMIGNFHVYEGPVELHEYAEALRELGGHILPRNVVLWILRLGLIAMFGLHIAAAYTTKEISRQASDNANWIDGQKSYPGGRDYVAANYASRTMRWTGPIILLYLIFHLADLTWGVLPHTDYVRGDPYHNLSTSLSNLPVAIIYIVANVALAIHIFHGTWSLFQSLGLNNPRYNSARRILATGLAGVILVGNLTFPILTQAGVIDPEDNPCEGSGSEAAALECFEHEIEKAEA